MKIHIPNSAHLGNMDQFIKMYDPKNPDKLVITANKKWISVHPMALAMIAALGINLKKSQIKCEKLEAKSSHYLERMGLFEILGIKSDMNISEHEPAGRFIPLTEINDSDAMTKFLTDMTPLLHLDKENAEPLRYIMSELIRNVLEHSLSRRGAIVSAQYFPKSNRIGIGIADAGIGIRKSMRQSYWPKNDLEAIRLALTPGITGTTRKIGGTETNAGAGLFFIKSIACVNKDFFIVYSGKAMYKLLKRKSSRRIVLNADPFIDRHSEKEDLPMWQGTVVGIDITLDRTSEFTALLKLMNETFSKAIKERKKERYKKPRFV